MIALLIQWKTMLAAGLAAAVLGLFALWRIEAGHARRLEGQVQAALAAQKGAESQAAAAGQAEAVVASGAQRDQRTITLHAENSHAIQTAEGSGQSVDPALNAAGRRGLCAYPSYAADPQCIQLLGADPAGRPSARGADAVAVP
jgi:hypothetical protein